MNFWAGTQHVNYDGTPIRGSGTPGKGGRARKPMDRTKRTILSVVITLVFALVHFYFSLPALNVHAGDLYFSIILLCVVFCACELIFSAFRDDSVKGYAKHTFQHARIPVILVALTLLVSIIGTVVGWRVFRSKDYASLLSVQDGDFAAEVSEISFDQIPMLDGASANVLANRKLGELSDLVSQFEVNEVSYQINYCNAPVRVTYLNYGDFFKWLNNHASGIPAYIVVDMVSQEVTVNRLEQGIRYSPSEYFFRNINRYLRFHYPTLIFDDVNFEIDDEGRPWWVASVITKRIGLFGGPDCIGAVLVNAVTGESAYYASADVPTWVDRVYTAELLIQQYDFHGLYKNGFFNSLFGQKDCTVTTDGYNYIAQDDDVWMYTGITSVGGDESNVGFILVNQRTKEAHYYACAGAEEFSAMNSAQGAVQQYSYAATFPLLLNISSQPTYFMALKDASSLVKMYAMVNVQQYQIVATGYNVSECLANYESLLVKNRVISAEQGIVVPAADLTEVTGRIADIRSAVIAGDTVYYLRLDEGDAWYTVTAAACPEAVIFDVGDRVTVRFAPSDGAIIPAQEVVR